jgi:hypothetical protein
MTRAQTVDRILLAIERVAASGREPSLSNVRARLIRDSRDDRGASFETLLPILRQWKADRLERASGRIEAAVDALVALRTKAERDEVRRLVEARTGGGIRVRMVARGRPRKLGLPGSGTARDSVAGRSALDRPPTGAPQ